MTTKLANPDTLGRRLFSFGVITDTHVNQGEDDCNSPYEANRLANRRMRHVVRDLNARDLAFVVNVGDLVHPVPAIPDLYAAAAARFHEQVNELKTSSLPDAGQPRRRRQAQRLGPGGPRP